MDLRTLIGERIDPDQDHLLARRLLGTDDPDELAVALEVLIRGLLRDEVRHGVHYHESVCIVVGVDLAGGERVAVKLHRPEWTAGLAERCRIQEHLRRAGLPCPEVVVDPTPVEGTVVTVERWLDGGIPDHPRAASTRAALAGGLHRFIHAGTPYREADLPAAMEPAPGSPHPEPHDLRFDFEATADEAAWIDELAVAARRVLGRDPDALGHVDWRNANVVVSERRVTAIYDWDSVAVGTETAFVGGASTTWSLAWEWGHRTLPGLDGMDGFVRDYERAAGRAFGPTERREVRAAQVLTSAYLARCEHSDRALGIGDPADTTFADLLRALTSSGS